MDIDEFEQCMAADIGGSAGAQDRPVAGVAECVASFCSSLAEFSEKLIYK